MTLHIVCVYFKEHVVTLQREMAQDEQKKKAELEHKKDVINQAEERHRHERDDDVDDSEVVDQIFGFLPVSYTHLTLPTILLV